MQLIKFDVSWFVFHGLLGICLIILSLSFEECALITESWASMVYLIPVAALRILYEQVRCFF